MFGGWKKIKGWLAGALYFKNDWVSSFPSPSPFFSFGNCEYLIQHQKSLPSEMGRIFSKTLTMSISVQVPIFISWNLFPNNLQTLPTGRRTNPIKNLVKKKWQISINQGKWVEAFFFFGRKIQCYRHLGIPVFQKFEFLFIWKIDVVQFIRNFFFLFSLTRFTLFFFWI